MNDIQRPCASCGAEAEGELCRQCEDWDEIGMWLDVMRYSKRRDLALHAAPRCPQCAAVQVQVTDWSVEPSEWRCRVCSNRFEETP